MTSLVEESGTSRSLSLPASSFLAAAFDDESSGEHPVTIDDSSEDDDDEKMPGTATTSIINPETPQHAIVEPSEQLKDDFDQKIAIVHSGDDDTTSTEEDERLAAAATTATAASKPRSILKRTPHEEIPVCSKRSAWKSLPKPDMKMIRAQSMPTFAHHHHVVASSDEASCCMEEPSAQTPPLKRSESTVSFADITIREYDVTLGDNPSVSYGAPITLDWKYQQGPSLTLDDYEINRGQRRKLRQMCLNTYQRKNMLMWTYGISEDEIKQAKREANKIKRQREITNAFLPFRKVEEVVQSAARKTKRAVSGKSKGDNNHNKTNDSKGDNIKELPRSFTI